MTIFERRGRVASIRSSARRLALAACLIAPVGIAVAAFVLDAGRASDRPLDARALGATEICDVPGDWARSADAEWLHGRLRDAGFGAIGCTGSALTIQLSPDSTADDAYVWTTRPPLDDEQLGAGGYRSAGAVEGVPVLSDGTRFVWRVAGRNIWASAGPTSRPDPTLDDLAPVIRAAR